jgi:hypothetical protein
MVYVRRSDNQGYLLTGDVAPTLANLTYQAGPSRLMNDFVQYQNRRAIHGWLLTADHLLK